MDLNQKMDYSKLNAVELNAISNQSSEHGKT